MLGASSNMLNKIISNYHCRHEDQKHGQKLADEEIPQEEAKADYKFNYHSAKLAFGLVLLEFNDALKEGDGDRLFELYKLALLIYKTHGHYKYAYGVLLYLVKCIAILPPSQALRLKWNRTYNVSGLPGRNIPLDLQKEHDNKDVKCMWRNLGANLDEHNAERTAGTLQSTQLVYQSVDRDCMVNEHHFARKIPNEEEAVNQITTDLLSNDVFKRTPGREGYASFPKFERNLLHNLDYRDLHKWLKEHIDLWGSIYQQER